MLVKLICWTVLAYFVFCLDHLIVLSWEYVCLSVCPISSFFALSFVCFFRIKHNVTYKCREDLNGSGKKLWGWDISNLRTRQMWVMPCALILGEISLDTYGIRGCVGPVCSLDAVAERNVLPGTDPHSSRPQLVVTGLPSSRGVWVYWKTVRK
jgi:hypothetical protein